MSGPGVVWIPGWLGYAQALVQGWGLDDLEDVGGKPVLAAAPDLEGADPSAALGVPDQVACALVGDAEAAFDSLDRDEGVREDEGNEFADPRT